MRHRAPVPPRPADLPRAPAAAGVPRRRGGRRAVQGPPHPDWDAWKAIKFGPFLRVLGGYAPLGIGVLSCAS